MQSFTDISSNTKLKDTLGLLLNNTKTVMSDFSGTSFPTTDLQLGMSCYRTDEKKLYKLEAIEPDSWKLIFDLNKTATDKEYVDAQITSQLNTLVDAAPGTLDTLNELASALGDDPNFAATVTNSLAGKVDNARVLTDVPAGAVFTDTVYTHPTTHSISEISGLQDALDGKLNSAGANYLKKDSADTSSGLITFSAGFSVPDSAWDTKAKISGTSPNLFFHDTANSEAMMFGLNGGYAYMLHDTDADGTHDTTDPHPFRLTLATGDLLIKGGLSTSSDKRLKSEITVIDSALSKLMQIGGYTYTRVDQESDARQAGVLAQEIMKILPEAVTGDSESGHLSVNYNSLTPLLIEAMKEQQAQIEVLKKSVASC